MRGINLNEKTPPSLVQYTTSLSLSPPPTTLPRCHVQWVGDRVVRVLQYPPQLISDVSPSFYSSIVRLTVKDPSFEFTFSSSRKPVNLPRWQKYQNGPQYLFFLGFTRHFRFEFFFRRGPYLSFSCVRPNLFVGPNWIFPSTFETVLIS